MLSFKRLDGGVALQRWKQLMFQQQNMKIDRRRKNKMPHNTSEHAPGTHAACEEERAAVGVVVRNEYGRLDAQRRAVQRRGRLARAVNADTSRAPPETTPRNQRVKCRTLTS